MPNVSIIVPVYNVAVFLPKCIDSILGQTYSDFELILVDDGSPDNCGEICDEYARRDYRVRVIHQKNRGVACARNAALDQASGQYISFCDSDDSLEKDFLETLISAIEASSADSVVSSFSHVYPDGTVVKGRTLPEGIRRLSDIRDKEEYIFTQILRLKVGWEIWTRLFRRDIIEKHHIRFCEYCDNFAEDLGFVLQYTLVSNGEDIIDYSGYKYFHRSNSMMRISETIVKLNPVNEISRFIFPLFSQVFSGNSMRLFTILHAEVLYNQSSKLLSEKPNVARKAFHAVKCQRWMKTHLIGILWCRKKLIRYCGKRVAWRIILMAHFAIHQNAFLFRAERSIINRCIICDV